MPPKAKLHKEKGKLKSIAKNVPISEPSTSEIDNQVQFEVELLWCIQQLQSALKSGKMNPKQGQEATKTLNTLMSNSTPVIRKRQLMRLFFGDYRDKMAKEETQYLKKNGRIVYVPNKSSKCVFVKKAPFLTSGKDFKFNFAPPSVSALQDNLETLKITDESDNKNNKICFEPSQNTFRFNFDVNN